jgi:hypothetical protein
LRPSADFYAREEVPAGDQPMVHGDFHRENNSVFGMNLENSSRRGRAAHTFLF